MKKVMTKVLVFTFMLFACGAAFGQDWQNTLENEFDLVETFNNIADWDGSGDDSSRGYGDVNTVSNSSKMPDYLGGGDTQWKYYSLWSGSTQPDSLWIGNHGASNVWNPKNEENPKSLRLDLGDSGLGPSRLARDLRDGGNNGYTDMRVFYMFNMPSDYFPETWSAYNKLAVINRGCEGDSCSASYGGANYSPNWNYHYTFEGPGSSGVRLRCLISGGHGYGESYFDFRPHVGDWLGIEFRARVNTTNKTAIIDAWLYDKNGELITQLYDKIEKNISDVWEATKDEKFDNFMVGGNIDRKGNNTVYYIDDIIFDDSSNGAIAPRYFNLINNGSDFTESTPSDPEGLHVVSN